MHDPIQELLESKPIIEKWLKFIHESKRNFEFLEQVKHMQFCLCIMQDTFAVKNHGDLLMTYVQEMHKILTKIPIPQDIFEKYTKAKSEPEATNWPAKEQLRAVKTEEERWGTGNLDFFTRRDNSRTNGDTRQPTIHQGSRNTSIGRGRGRGLSVARNESTWYCLDRKGNRTIPWNHETVKKEEDFDSPRNLAPDWLTGEADADEVEEVTPAASKYTRRIKPEPLLSQNPSTFQRRPLQNNIGGGRVRRDSDIIIVEERPVQLPPQDRQQNSQRRRQPSSTVTREQVKNHDNYEKLYERRSRKETQTPETSFSSQDVHRIDDADIIDYCDPNQKGRLEKEMENNGGTGGQGSEVNSPISLSAPASTGRMEVTRLLPQNRIQKAIQYFPNEAMGAEGGVYYNENDRNAPATSHPPPRQVIPASTYVQALQPSSHGRIPDHPPSQAQPGASRWFIPPVETAKSLKKTGLLKSGRFIGPKSRAPGSKPPGPSNSTAPQENAPPPRRLPTSPLLPPAPRPPPCLSIRPRQDRDSSVLRLDRSLPLNSQRKVRFAPPTHEDIQRQVDDTLLTRFPMSKAPAIEKAPQNKIPKAQEIRNQVGQEGFIKLGRNPPTKRSGGIEAAVFSKDIVATTGPSNNPNNINARARQDEQNPPKEKEPEKQQQQQQKEFRPEESNRKRKSRETEDETSSENSPKRSSPPPPGSESSGSSSISEPSSSTSNPKNGEGATTSSPPSPPPPSPPPSPPPPQPALSPISVAENRTDDAIPSTSSTATAPINSAAPPPPANSSDETSRSILLDIKPILHHSGEFEDEEIGQIISDPDTLREFTSTIKSEFGRERREYVPKKRMQQQKEPEAPPPPPGYQEPGPSTARGRGRPRKTNPAASPPTPKRTGPVTRGQLKKKPKNFYKENVNKPTETTELIGKRYTQDYRSTMGSLDTLVHRGLGKIKLENDIHNPVIKEEEVEPESIEMGSSEANSGSSSNNIEEEIIISSSDDEES